MKIPAWDERQLYTSSATTRAFSSPLQVSSSPSPDVEHHGEKTIAPSKSCTSVSFAPEQDNVIHDILPLSEYTASEVYSCWFTRVEYNTFKRDSLVTLSMNRSGELSPDDPHHTMRGLECRTRECTDSRRIIRYRAAAAVFDEQARQRATTGGVTDPETISQSYHSVAWHALYDAHTQGMADEQDVLLLDSSVDVATSSFEDDLFAPASAASMRNTVLSKVIAIDGSEVEQDQQPPLVAGLDCRLWADSGSSATSEFNLNSFFMDLSVGAIAVAAA